MRFPPLSYRSRRNGRKSNFLSVRQGLRGEEDGLHEDSIHRCEVGGGAPSFKSHGMRIGWRHGIIWAKG